MNDCTYKVTIYSNGEGVIESIVSHKKNPQPCLIIKKSKSNSNAFLFKKSDDNDIPDLEDGEKTRIESFEGIRNFREKIFADTSYDACIELFAKYKVGDHRVSFTND